MTAWRRRVSRQADLASHSRTRGRLSRHFNPVWVHNLRANPSVEIRDLAAVQRMRVREVDDEAERSRLWALAVAAYPPYAEYQAKTTRRIPVFVAEPAR